MLLNWTVLSDLGRDSLRALGVEKIADRPDGNHAPYVKLQPGYIKLWAP